jgi:hypothetical protein
MLSAVTFGFKLREDCFGIDVCNGSNFGSLFLGFYRNIHCYLYGPSWSAVKHVCNLFDECIIIVREILNCCVYCVFCLYSSK